MASFPPAAGPLNLRTLLTAVALLVAASTPARADTEAAHWRNAEAQAQGRFDAF